jgi:hypothetical protein
VQECESDLRHGERQYHSGNESFDHEAEEDKGGKNTHVAGLGETGIGGHA